jgi:hypothetical protein
MRAAKALGIGAAVLAAGLTLAACSNGPATVATTSTTTQATTTTAAPVTTTTAHGTTTTATIKCQLSQLHIAHVGSQGAAGTEENTFSLTNVSQATCTLFGYPGMQLLSSGGQSLPTTVVRGGGTTVTGMSPQTVTLAPSAVAYFNVTSSDVTTANTTCSAGTQLEVTPPTNTTHATLPLSIRACDNGRLDTSPVFGSTNSAATQTTAPAG